MSQSPGSGSRSIASVTGAAAIASSLVAPPDGWASAADAANESNTKEIDARAIERPPGARTVMLSGSPCGAHRAQSAPRRQPRRRRPDVHGPVSALVDEPLGGLARPGVRDVLVGELPRRGRIAKRDHAHGLADAALP